MWQVDSYLRYHTALVVVAAATEQVSHKQQANHYDDSQKNDEAEAAAAAAAAVAARAPSPRTNERRMAKETGGKGYRKQRKSNTLPGTLYLRLGIMDTAGSIYYYFEV